MRIAAIDALCATAMVVSALTVGGCATDTSTQPSTSAQTKATPYKAGAPVTQKHPGGLRAGDTGRLISTADVAMAFSGELELAMAGARIINIAPGSGVDPHPNIDDLAIDKAARDALWTIAAERGYSPAETGQTADRLIGFAVTIDQPSDDMTMAMRFGINPGVRPSSSSLITIDERGTLVLVVIDPARNRILWRGAAQGILDPGSSTRTRTKKVAEAAQRLLGDLPPAHVIPSAESQ